MSQDDVGTFVIESGAVRISDPCYEPDGKCSGVLENVKNGLWSAIVVLSDEGGWGKRVSELIVSHSAFINRNKYEKAPFEVGVDSGQAGVFDIEYYQNEPSVAHLTDADRLYTDEKICENEPWYSWCCDRTLSESRAGVIPFGAVSSSGFGDGGYDCFFHKNNDGEIDSVKIVFIPDEEEIDYECEDGE